MFLDTNAEEVLRFIINCDKYAKDQDIETEKISSRFPQLSDTGLSEIVELLKDNGYIDAFLNDAGAGVVWLLHTGRSYFEAKALELEQNKPSISVNNSSNVNIGNRTGDIIGNNNTVSIQNGTTVDEVMQAIEQSTLSDKEALKEVIALLDDVLKNNKPIEPSNFEKVLSRIKSVAPLFNYVGKVVVSKMTGKL